MGKESAFVVVAVLGASFASAAHAAVAETKSAASADALGKRVYEHHCAECHGATGHGDGPNRFVLPVRPFDLTSPHMTHEMSDADIFQVVTNGIRSRSMPSFKRRLTVDERNAVVRYVRVLGAAADAPPSGAGSSMSGHAHEHDDGEHKPMHDGMHMHGEHEHHMPTSSAPWPLTREASGTAWVPDSTPMFGLMRDDNGWLFMFHGDVATGPNLQLGDRGALQWTTIGWVMAMASHDIPTGNLGGRVMLSPEPLLLPGNGYPLLLQTGETFHDVPLHDRQHPHDLFMELAATYRTVPVLGASGELYAALAGEPALGPAAFPHRVSAMGDPMAPLSHHWLDSTHISFGVVTAGIGTKTFKVEGSLFNGHEPDENRFNLDLAPLSSWSVRVQAAPVANLALQASYGYLVGPEALHPDENVSRTTTSATWNQPFGDSNWATLVAFGNNRTQTTTQVTSSSAFLAESSLDLFETHVLFARSEVVGKDPKELLVTTTRDVVYVPEATLGYEYVFDPAFEFVPAVGASVTASVVDDVLAPVYGTHFPVGGWLYVRVRGAKMQM